MYKSKKKEDGTYSPLAYISRAAELINPIYLRQYIRDYLPDYRFGKNLKIFIDYYFCLVRYGAIVNDYFEYEFWKKRSCERKQYVTMTMNKKIKKIFNNEKTGIFRNKMLFNEKFAKFRCLKCFDLLHDTQENFLEFVKDCDRNIIAKPLTGYSGIDIHKPDVSTDEKAIQVYQKLKATGDFFCEEAFVQTGVLHEVNPSSVNTVRIYTVHDGEKAHVTFTTVRFGGSTQCVDNIHAGGMCCNVDRNTGHIIGAGYDLSGHMYITHPISQKMLLGLQIPNWATVMSMITEAAELYPEQGHIAWDIAVSEDKVSIIEGNDGGNFDLPQVCQQKGCKPLYDAFLKKRKEMEKRKRA